MWGQPQRLRGSRREPPRGRQRPNAASAPGAAGPAPPQCCRRRPSQHLRERYLLTRQAQSRAGSRAASPASARRTRRRGRPAPAPGPGPRLRPRRAAAVCAGDRAPPRPLLPELRAQPLFPGGRYSGTAGAGPRGPGRRGGTGQDRTGRWSRRREDPLPLPLLRAAGPARGAPAAPCRGGVGSRLCPE